MRNPSLLALLLVLAASFTARALEATPAPTLADADRLAGEQKLEAALRKTKEILAAAREKKDAALTAEALIKATQLEMGLRGFETAVRFLKAAPWPADPGARVLLNLYYGQALMEYEQQYGWEIREREKRADKKGDLKSWTSREIGRQIDRSFDDAAAEGAWLDQEPPAYFASYLTRNDYPAGVRPTLRAAVTYLAVEHLANQRFWAPEEQARRYQLGPARLAGHPTPTRIAAAEESAHPLERVASWLGSLESTYSKQGRTEAALEARYVLIQTLHQSFTEEQDREAVLKVLRDFQAHAPRKPWWSRGQALLSDFLEAGPGPDRRVRARLAAVTGRDAFPGSAGSQMCAARLHQIEQPELALQVMGSDAAERRSIQLTYRNLRKAYFRAYKFDFDASLHGGYGADPFAGSDDDLKGLLRSGAPAAAWSAELPEAKDYFDHRRFVSTPPLPKGRYRLVVSPREDFSGAASGVIAASFTVSDLVLVMRRMPDSSLEVRALSGDSGRPVPGAELTLYQVDAHAPVTEAAKALTDHDGYARIAPSKDHVAYDYFLVGRFKGDAVFGSGNLYFGSRDAEEKETKSAFVYTDRAIFRPGQKVLFKVVAFSGKRGVGRFHVAKAGETVKVSLVDPSSETVVEKDVRLGEFGSGSGELEVPAGKALGDWTVRAGTAKDPVLGVALVRVEEYKRPTFEASFKDAAEPLRLNRPARFTGEARYYFGLPVTGGEARWKVTRAEVLPWWWEAWGWWRGGAARDAEPVASGTAKLGKDGSFSFDFLPEADERRAKEKDVSYRFELTADVTDEGGETRTARRNFRLGFVAVDARLEWESGFFRLGKAFSLNARLSDLNDKPLEGEGSYRVARLAAPPSQLPADLARDSREEPAASAFDLPDDHLRARWETRFRWESVTHAWKEAETAAEGRVKHDAQGKGKIPVPALERGGVYRVTYRTEDPFGAPLEVSRDFIVAGSNVNLPLVVALEEPSVKPGGTARLLARSGLVDQPLVLEVFRGDTRVDRRELSGTGGDGVIEFPVSAEDRGGLTFVVSGVRDHQALEADASLTVPWSDRELKLELATFRDRLRPGDKETFKVTVRDAAGGDALSRGAAEVLAYMYDRSLDFFGLHTAPEVSSIYPTRPEPPPPQFSLSSIYGGGLYSNRPTAPQSPVFTPDRLARLQIYGIGGPGSRRYGLGAGGPVEMEFEEAAGASPAVASDFSQARTGVRITSPVQAAAMMPQLRKRGEADSSGPRVPAPSVMRTNFAETALFAPQLVTGKDGSASVEFTAPDSVTSWKFLAHAITKDMRGGTVEAQTRTVKELMVRPYAPRFFREGDSADLRVQVNNAGSDRLSGELELSIEDLSTGKNADADFGLASGNAKFNVAPGGSATLSFPLTAPRRVGDYAFRATARANGFSDGERRPFPVLPSRLHLVQSRFRVLNGRDSQTLAFPDLAAGKDKTMKSEKLVVTVDGQLFYGVLKALPYLVDYPYGCVEQTLNRFISTGILSSLFGKYPAVAEMAKKMSERETSLERFDGDDPNRRMRLEETPFDAEAKGGAGADPVLRVLDPKVASGVRDVSLEKLRKLQRPDGSFPWFEGGRSDEYMTLYVLIGLSRALEFKADVPKDVVTEAWGFEKAWLDEALPKMLEKGYGWETVTQLLFALSSYPDDSWTGGYFSGALRKILLDFSFRHWKEHAPLEKGYLALTLHRLHRDRDAALVWDSVMDSAKSDEQLGTFWAREDRSWLWYRDEVDTQAFALRTQLELAPADKRNAGLVQWLFLNKKLNHWKSTRATAEAIYSLAAYLDQHAELGVPEDVKVALGGSTASFHFDPAVYAGGRNQVVVAGDKVDPATMSRITVSKATSGFAFASATWQFATDELPKEERGDFFFVSRKYFRRETGGKAVRLVPLAAGAEVRVGDEIEVRLSVRSKHEAEYVHLRDPRGAGFEPETNVSGWKYDLGLSWFEETRDSGADFFFARIPVGEFEFHYRLRATMAGKFRVGPAEVESLYAPEFSAYSAGAELRVH